MPFEYSLDLMSKKRICRPLLKMIESLEMYRRTDGKMMYSIERGTVISGKVACMAYKKEMVNNIFFLIEKLYGVCLDNRTILFSYLYNRNSIRKRALIAHIGFENKTIDIRGYR